MAKKPIEANYAATPDQVFDACLMAVAQLGYTIQHSDKGSHVLSFNTGRSMRSWGGRDVTAQLLGTADNGTRIVVSGRVASGGMPGGGGSQVASWGELKKVSRAFLTEVEAVLPQVARNKTSPVPSSSSSPSPDSAGQSVAAELADLTRLRDRGAISDAEFAAAKARVLDRGIDAGRWDIGPATGLVLGPSGGVRAALVGRRGLVRFGDAGILRGAERWA